MTGPGATILGVLMLASIAMTVGGVYLIATQRDRKRGVLMLIAAAVFAANVAIWTL